MRRRQFARAVIVGLAIATAFPPTTGAAGASTVSVSGSPTRIPPRHVVATQGPTDPSSLWVMITWDRSDPEATGYNVQRDGALLATVPVVGDAWDDLAYTDASVEASRTYSYQVTARFADGTQSDPSTPTRLRVRSGADLGAGKIFEVDRQSGSDDLTKAQKAVDAAKANGGGVVLFAARTYSFSAPLKVDGTDNVVLRGAGQDRTFLQPSFAGAGAVSGASPILIRFTGTRKRLSTVLAAAVGVGDRSVRVNSTAGLAPKQVVIFDQKASQAEPTWFDTNEIIQDPGTGRDDRYRWDANEIAAVDAATNTVTFKYPFSQSFTTAVPWVQIDKGKGNGLELLTIQGRSSGESTYYRLVSITDESQFSVADVQSRWANQNYFLVSGYEIRFVRFRGPNGGPKSYTEGVAKYKISVARASNFSFVGGTMGEATDDRNKSFITTQWAQRTLVRNSQFYGSRNYAFNEHGGGSRHIVFENNFIRGNTNTEYGGVYLGNSTWGFSGSAILRNNLQVGGPRFLHMEENSYEIRVLDNVARNLAPSPLPQGTTSARFIYGEGWKGPDTAPDLYSSLRMTVRRNSVSKVSGDGVDLGRAGSNFYPILGVKDVVIADNSFDVTGAAVRLQGSSTDTRRFQVFDNSGSAKYVKPAFVSGDYWAGNGDGVSYGRPTDVTWSEPVFAWETYDRG